MRIMMMAVASLVFLPGAGLAMQCGTRDAVVDALANGYGEQFAGAGLQSETRMMEVWTSAESGTWTILMTRADGTTCIVASGTDWRMPLPNEQIAGTPS